MNPPCHSLRTGVEAVLMGLGIDFGHDFWLRTLSFKEITERETTEAGVRSCECEPGN